MLMILTDAIETIIGLTKRKISYADVANALGVSRQYAHQLRNKEIPDKYVRLLETYFSVNLTGDNDVTGEECLTLQHVHLNPSCGRGTSVYYDADITPVKLGTQMIKNILNVSRPENLKIFKACGDSMSPTIDNGDRLIVEHWNGTQIQDNKIYVFCFNNEFFVKRLSKNLDEIIIKSDNPEYRIRTINGSTAGDLTLIGKIVGVIKSL